MENPGRVPLNKGRNARECDALSERDSDGWMDGWTDRLTTRYDVEVYCVQKSEAQKIRENDETAKIKIHRNNRKFN